MNDRETDVDRELGRRVEEKNQQQYEIAKQIDNMLAYGSINLGLNKVKKENEAEERIKEDLNKLE